MSADPLWELGEFLSAEEARRLIGALADGDTTAQALKEIHPGRRDAVRRLFNEANLGADRPHETRDILAAVAGAHSVKRAITPVWTMPGAQATTGRLTSEVQRIIDDARLCVVCSSFNFTPRSAMWSALKAASERPGVTVTVYLDATAGGSSVVAAHLPNATVYRTITLPGGKTLVSHAKFVIVDHMVTFLTSANFSYAAENTNIELGLLVIDPTLAESIETQMAHQHGTLYERA